LYQQAKPFLRAKVINYFCDFTEKEKYEESLWATSCRFHADLCRELFFLGDVARWIGNLVTKYFPQAIKIVDWFHAEEHLEMVANATFPPGEDRYN
jgi:hypothetical protein